MMISFNLFKLNQATDHAKRRESRRRSVFEDGESEVNRKRDRSTSRQILKFWCAYFARTEVGGSD